MINKILVSMLIVLLTGLSSANSFADAGAEREAEKLLTTMNMSEVMEKSIAQMINVQIQQNPGMAPYRAVLLEFFGKHMNFERLKGDMVFIYAEAFSEQELKSINAFYSSSVGQKTIRLMPELMAKGSQVGQQRIQDNLPELQEMIQAESKRILELQNQQQ